MIDEIFPAGIAMKRPQEKSRRMENNYRFTVVITEEINM